MKSEATTVEEYLAQLPEDRREAISMVREVILANLPDGVEEGMGYGMIGYCIPHSVYPKGYHCNPKLPLPFISLASQKNHMAVYMFCVYCSPEKKAEFQKRYLETGKKLDMGGGCVRFKKLENLPLDLIGETIAGIQIDKFIEMYESVGKR
jgi:hypothetical protein